MSLEEYRARLKRRLEQNRAAFEGEYADELRGLTGLSETELAELSPDTTDHETYNNLITVVREASAANISQAELVSQIKELGDVAVSIAKKVPKLAMLLA
jgi:hypothetical protein